MAGTTKKWLIGCGIGCGLFFLVMAIGGTVAFFGVRKAMDHGKQIESGFEELRASFGGPGEFTPEPDGSVPYDRMETFLAARDSMAGYRQEVGDLMRTLDDQREDGMKPNFIDKAKAGINLVPSLMGFIHHRNQALLSVGMGVGEYLYIYSLAYFDLLKVDLADGPSFALTGQDDEGNNSGFHWEAGAHSSKGRESGEDREHEIRSYLHRIQLKMARNQLEKLDQVGGHEESRNLLVAELAAMEEEPLRLLWETGLPEAVRASLEPFRGRLEASYDPMVNVLESGLVENE